ncbi:DUF602-domain-containing protein [Stereum hirsutum FP-91666 SS1]|uniref:DUF602-domain-containing protein n=1 Tax=Stereum hirsutum (strain FP-91666) TaxID=721885 RepID=UPI000440D824|nr:DUF602-domain-containing protein [Stereum hirsutum FP-91666 SS1]EIM91881.1 DUF602-domain-containing protein [Stereum hirsutum FP-91666 SS1]
MGNDGGSIPDRRDLVRSKPKAEQADKANQTRARWFSCALSKRPLREPIVSCALGKLYNKDALLEFLLDRGAYGDGEEICGHIRSLKDVKTLNLTPNTTPSSSTSTSTSNSINEDAPTRALFVCPLTLKEMTGAVPFVYISTCGCVFSQAGLKTLTSASASSSSPPSLSLESEGKEKDVGEKEKERQLDVCPQCATKFDKTEDVRTINPSSADEEKMRVAMQARRLVEAATKSAKSKSKKRKAAATSSSDSPDANVNATSLEPPKKKTAKEDRERDRERDRESRATANLASINGVGSTSRAVASSLAMEEAKRKAGMSEAVKSLYGPKDGVKRKETFMTMGTFTRYA